MWLIDLAYLQSFHLKFTRNIRTILQFLICILLTVSRRQHFLNYKNIEVKDTRRSYLTLNAWPLLEAF
jgi:uncharacterized membrane protein